MLQKIAYIVKTDANNLWLDSVPEHSCLHCHQNDCGLGILNKSFQQRLSRRQLSHCQRPDNSWGQKLAVGDSVHVCTSEQQVLKAAMWLYLLPLVLLFAFALGYQRLAVLWAWPQSDLILALCGLGGLYCGLLLARWFNAKQAQSWIQIKPITHVL